MFRFGLVLACFGFVLFCVTPVIHAMSAEQKQKVHEHFEAIAMDCLKDNQIDEPDVANLRGRKPIVGEHTPCFLACMFKKIGVIDDEGMLQKETALEKIKMVLEESEELKMAEEFLHTCTAVNSEPVQDGAKGCDRSLKAYTCMIDKASQFGIEF